MISRVCGWLLAVLLCVAWAPGAAWCETRTLLVVGRAPTGENQALARQQALTDALHNAVAQAAVSLLEPATLRGQLNTLSEQVLAKAKSFVVTYSQQGEVHQGGVTRVLASVSVDLTALERVLAATGLKLPTLNVGPVLVLVSEETAPGRPPVFWWSGAPGLPGSPPLVSSVLAAVGVKVSDPQPLRQKLTPQMRKRVLSEAEALELGRQAQAALVIMGRIRSYPLVTQGKRRPQPVAQLIALDVRSQKTLATAEELGPVYRQIPPRAAGEKVAAAVQSAVRRLLGKVAAALPGVRVASREITLTVRGISSLAQLFRFEEILASLRPLVSSVQRISATAGSATLRLRLAGSPAKLADLITVKEYPGFLVNVVGFQEGAMTVVLVPKNQGS